MKAKLVIGVLASALILAGCASTPQQQPIAMNGAALHGQGTQVGIAMKVPKVDTSFPGAACLLCIAAASAANSSLTSYTQKLPSDDVVRIKSDLADALRKKGYAPTMLPDDFAVDKLSKSAGGPNKPVYDFSSLRDKYHIDKLVVVEISELGISRNYSSYFPTGEPQSVVKGVGYMVNLADNTYEWYQPIAQAKTAGSPWDEAPSYPGLTNAYFQVVEGARDTVLKPFAN